MEESLVGWVDWGVVAGCNVEVGGWGWEGKINSKKI